MKHLLAALLLTVATPAYAMTQTFTDVTTARYTYTPGQEGIFSVNFTAELGPIIDSIGSSNYPRELLSNSPLTRAEGYICGIYRGCVFDITRLSSTAGVSWLAGCFGPADQNCSLVSTWVSTFNSEMFIPYRDALGEVTFMFDIWGTDFRPLISSTVTFTGPDPVPLPSTLLLFGSALAGLVCLRRKRVSNERA